MRRDLSPPLLSIIIPAFNEENRLPTTLVQVNDFIQTQPYESEILIVENGSKDHTFQIARDFSEQNPHFRVIHEERRGKGLAVKRGMLESRGEFRFMCDADLSMPVSEIPRFLPPLLNDIDVAIASREAVGSRRIHEPFYRHLGGRMINFMIRILALPGLQDTQCGFKCFRRQAAEDLFSHLTLTGWAFDVEVLYIARRRGYRMAEIPIPWYFDPESKLSLARDTLRMGLDLLTIRKNDWQGRYKPSI